MTPEAVQHLWNTYERGWANVSAAERDHLLQQSLADDCYSANPSDDGRGRERLKAGMEAFQQQLAPGGHIKTHTLSTHHNYLLASWQAFGSDGAVILTGTTTARFHDDGRLTDLIGFWPV